MSSKDDVSLDEMLAEVARHVPADKQHLLAGHRTELRDMRNLGEYCKRLRQLFGADMLVKILTGLKGLQAKRVDKAGYAPVITLFTAPKPHGPGKGMMMAVVNGVCAEWCPTESTYLNMIKVGDGTHSTSKSTDLGPATVHGQGVEKWSWGLGPGGIPLEKFTISLSAKAGNFTPVELQIDSSLERFHEISDFSEFSGAPLDPSVFAVSGMDTCKESPKCSSDAAKTFLSGFSKPELEIEME